MNDQEEKNGIIDENSNDKHKEIIKKHEQKNQGNAHNELFEPQKNN